MQVSMVEVSIGTTYKWRDKIMRQIIDAIQPQKYLLQSFVFSYPRQDKNVLYLGHPLKGKSITFIYKS